MTKFARMARPAQPGDAAAAPAADAPALPKAPTKQSLVLDMLRRKEGALLADIVAATGWLPHTARAALTGLKKKGHAIESRRADKQTTYFLA